MQLLYLVPPALFLWRSFSDSSTALVLITPVIVMAAGQLAGGLAWLTISGEDAADLVATAPLPPSRVTRAKVEVVLIVIGVIFAPLVAGLAFVAPLQAVVTTAGTRQHGRYIKCSKPDNKDEKWCASSCSSAF